MIYKNKQENYNNQIKEYVVTGYTHKIAKRNNQTKTWKNQQLYYYLRSAKKDKMKKTFNNNLKPT